MATTPNNGLPLIDSSMTADVPRDMNALAQAVDGVIGDMSTVPTMEKTTAGAISELYSDIENIDPIPPDGSITDAKIGTRTIDDTIAATAGPDTPTRLWSKLANMIKAITGKANWYTPPVTSIESLSNNKLDKSAYTAADVLAKLKTVDGPGSELDADTLAGKHAADFVLSSNYVQFNPLNAVNSWIG